MLLKPTSLNCQTRLEVEEVPRHPVRVCDYKSQLDEKEHGNFPVLKSWYIVKNKFKIFHLFSRTKLINFMTHQE